MTLPILGMIGHAGSGKSTICAELAKHGIQGVSIADPMKRFLRDGLGFESGAVWGPSAERNKPHHDPAMCRHRIESFFADGSCPLVFAAIQEWGFRDEQRRELARVLQDFLRRLDCPDGLTARHALQQIGTEYARKAGVDFAGIALKAAYEVLRKGLWYHATTGLGTMLGEFRRGIVIQARLPEDVFAIREAGGRIARVVRGSVVNTDPHPTESEQDSIPSTMVDFVVHNHSGVDVAKVAANLYGQAFPNPIGVYEVSRGAP